MLLPVASFAGSEQRLQSFIAAIILGLKHRFRGNIDHLEATIQEEPLLKLRPHLQKKYLVLAIGSPVGQDTWKGESVCRHDDGPVCRRACRPATLPGAAGSGEGWVLPAVYTRAGPALICTLHISRHIPSVPVRDPGPPREAGAIEHDHAHQPKQFIECELEAYFMKPCIRDAATLPVQLRKDIVHHKTGWYCKVNEYGYYIEPQVELSRQRWCAPSNTAGFCDLPSAAEAPAAYRRISR